MATCFEALLVGNDEEHLMAVGEAALDEVARIERLLSRHDPASDPIVLDLHEIVPRGGSIYPKPRPYSPGRPLTGPRGLTNIVASARPEGRTPNRDAGTPGRPDRPEVTAQASPTLTPRPERPSAETVTGRRIAALVVVLALCWVGGARASAHGAIRCSISSRARSCG